MKVNAIVDIASLKHVCIISMNGYSSFKMADEKWRIVVLAALWVLTHWDRDKISTILQTIFSNAFLDKDVRISILGSLLS